MMRSMTAAALGAAAMGLVLAASTVARAEDETATRSVAVSLKDLDLTAPAGRALARQRIDAAAHDACEAADLKHLHVGADYMRCRAAALDGASAQLEQFVATAQPRMPSVKVTDSIGR